MTHEPYIYIEIQLNSYSIYLFKILKIILTYLRNFEGDAHEIDQAQDMVASQVPDSIIF